MGISYTTALGGRCIVGYGRYVNCDILRGNDKCRQFRWEKDNALADTFRNRHLNQGRAVEFAMTTWHTKRDIGSCACRRKWVIKVIRVNKIYGFAATSTGLALKWILSVIMVDTFYRLELIVSIFTYCGKF